MELVPNQVPPERLISSMEAQESTSTEAASDSPFVLKGAGMMSGNARWVFIGARLVRSFFRLAELFLAGMRRKKANDSAFQLLLKPDTQSGCARFNRTAGANRHSAKCRNGTRQRDRAWSSPVGRDQREDGSRRRQRHFAGTNAAVALILRVVKIGDGSIDLSDGTKMFSAQ